MSAIMRTFFKHPNGPVLILIVFNLIAGLLTFRDYGLTLDEPLYYQYADSLGYAYSPKEWFSGDFDLENAFGPSAADHQNRGPAYLLIARVPARFLQSILGMDYPSAWHLINFIFFQIGVYFFFALCRRWMGSWAAFAATIFFVTQPLLWGHAFINPKDMPFLVAFLVSLELGFRMADRIANSETGEKPSATLKHILLPAILLGLSTNLRILGPLSGALAFVYFLFLGKPAKYYWFIPYGAIAVITLFATWPYLWQAPIQNLLNVMVFFSDNPTELRVLFLGGIYTADHLPLRYLPTLMLITLTEPVWPLAIVGSCIALWRARLKTIDWKTLPPILLWFLVPVLYVLIRRPAMYDGFRHSLFILPPVFVLTGIALEALFARISMPHIKAALIGFLILPALWANVMLHPYQYTYYNQFVGGTGKASHQFETDYWSTCYKEAVEKMRELGIDKPVLYVGEKGVNIIKFYSGDDLDVRVYKQPRQIYAGQYALSSSRVNIRLQLFQDSDDSNLTKIGRDHAIFCLIQRSK